jgi:hypothetical protein
MDLFIYWIYGMKDCSHKWYMRDPGIQCVKCFIVWDISMESDVETDLKTM